MKGIGVQKDMGTGEDTTVSGLKEALSISTENAVINVSKMDGYLANEAIIIMMLEKIMKVADVMKKVGYEKQVDDFVTRMNRAAEKAAPAAASHFGDAIKGMTFEDAKGILSGGDAIKGMTFEDAKGILSGGDTAATDYFKTKTSDKLYEDFKPIVSSSMNEVGVTKSYKTMMGKYTSLPFMKEESVDLDHYVANKSLDGLFYMIAQEEMKIRTDPAARVTDLLKKVFGK
jgi:hypothetical protein